MHLCIAFRQYRFFIEGFGLLVYFLIPVFVTPFFIPFRLESIYVNLLNGQSIYGVFVNSASVELARKHFFRVIFILS